MNHEFAHPRTRRGFLLLDLLAGAALAGLALGLTVVLLQSDMKVRHAQDVRHRLLIQAENAIERLGNLDPRSLDQKIVEKTFVDLAAFENLAGARFEIDVVDLTEEPKGKRVTLRGFATADRPAAVFLVRDFHFESGKP